MYFHYQDLRKTDRTKHLLYGRCWIGHEFLHLEWAVPTRSWKIEIQLNHYDETALQFSFACGLFALYISTENRRLYRFFEKFTKRKDMKYTHGRIIGISYYDKLLSFSLWYDPMESRFSDPKWWHQAIFIDDLIFGRSKCTIEILKEDETKIDMPEGLYFAKYKVERRTWKRPRWPFKTTRESIWFDIPVGIPHEGKGENSYDCGMDATFGIREEWNGNIYSAAKKVAMRCLHTRQRYGSLGSPEYLRWKLAGEERLRKEVISK